MEEHLCFSAIRQPILRLHHIVLHQDRRLPLLCLSPCRQMLQFRMQLENHPHQLHWLQGYLLACQFLVHQREDPLQLCYRCQHQDSSSFVLKHRRQVGP